MILPRSRHRASRAGSAGRSPSLPARSAPWLPALFALLFAAWCGTFHLGASAAGASAAHGLILAAGCAGAALATRRGGVAALLDPLELGRSGRILLWALLAATVLAWWLSPVPRAGRVGLTLLPAFLFLPAAAAGAFGGSGAASGSLGRSAGGRRGVSASGPRSVALAVGGVGAWALGGRLAGTSALPAEPLGHHLLLATWLVTLVPLAALPLLETTGSVDRPGRGVASAWRVVAGAATSLGAGAVLATGSVAGVLALMTQAGVALAFLRRGGGDRIRGRRLRRVVGLLYAVAVPAVAAVVVATLRSGNASVQARAVYWRAGWAGALERPFTGFGPGATAWTLADFLRPVPGINPPGEVVGELHLLPLAIAYELGLPALALAAGLGGLFLLRRGREAARGADPVLAAAGLAGLAGAGTMGLATADWRVTALPVAVSVAAGAALAGCRRPMPARRRATAEGARPGWSAALYGLAAVAVLLPLDRAHHLHERAHGNAGAAERAAALQRAVELDPDFPLYRFQAAREEWRAASRRGTGPQADARRASDALATAEGAVGVAPLWLRAGAVAAAVGSEDVAAAALERACALDPLGAMAPFSLLAVGSPRHRPAALGARALAAEPRLAAALLWEERPDLLESALAEILDADGIDPGWREELARRARSLPRGAGAGPVADLAVVVDGRAAASLSLHTFRRLPRRVELVPVPLRRRGADAMDGVPPATVLPGTDPRHFPVTCTGAFAPQTLRKTLWKTR